jgi:hypothetical protein
MCLDSEHLALHAGFHLFELLASPSEDVINVANKLAERNDG